MTPPTTQKGDRNFISLVNYYHNMLARCSHILDPLTNLTPSKVQFKWTQIRHKLFKGIKQTVARNALLAYRDSNKVFKIYQF